MKGRPLRRPFYWALQSCKTCKEAWRGGHIMIEVISAKQGGRIMPRRLNRLFHSKGPIMESGFKATLKDAIRTIPDYPKPGVQFRDVTTLMGDAGAFRRSIDELVYPYAGNKVDKVAGIEARGFILGGAIAHQLSAG